MKDLPRTHLKIQLPMLCKTPHNRLLSLLSGECLEDLQLWFAISIHSDMNQPIKPVEKDNKKRKRNVASMWFSAHMSVSCFHHAVVTTGYCPHGNTVQIKCLWSSHFQSGEGRCMEREEWELEKIKGRRGNGERERERERRGVGGREREREREKEKMRERERLRRGRENTNR